MIRFVDIRNQGTGYRFAFWDTSSDRFVTLAGFQGWASWSDFAEDHVDDRGAAGLDQFKALCPDWVDDGQDDDVQRWQRQA